MKLIDLAEELYDLINKNPELSNKEVLFFDVDSERYQSIEVVNEDSGRIILE
jgi:alpha-galactosidase/6-phospho-beta-glucosidase family protein